MLRQAVGRTGVRKYSAPIVLVATLLTTACANCPATILQTAKSPGGEYVATVESYDCSAVGPFNNYANIKAPGIGSTTVTKIVEAPYVLRVDWHNSRELTITIECPFESAASCSKPKDRNWTVTTQRQWRDVKIAYQVGPKLRRWLGPDALAIVQH
jgi:hypothetical protein